jgi:glycosyltransferase involved in cell wall biosynthesis
MLPTADERRRARRELDLADDAFVVMTAGRLVAVKDIGTLIDAHAQLVRRHPVARTVIIGDGEQRDELAARANALGVADTLCFAGYRSDVRALMAAADVYVNCSIYEGVSLTILEAMATGLPVVATPVGGTPEVVVDEQTGVLVSGGAAAIAGELSRLAWEPHTAAAMGEAGRRRVERHFSLSRMVDEYAAAYRCSQSLIPSAPAAVPDTAPATR